MNKKFIVIPEKKTVIAMLEKNIALVDELKNVNENFAFILNRIDFIFGRTKSSNSLFKSYAKCVDTDTFDESISKKIASKKVETKFHTSMCKQCNRYIRFLEEMIDALKEIRYLHETVLKEIKEND